MQTETHRKVSDIAQELWNHPDVIAVKVWTVGDVLDSSANWAEDHDIVLDKCEWDELENRVRMNAVEASGVMKAALSDCRDEEWDVVYEYVSREVDDIVKSRKA